MAIGTIISIIMFVVEYLPSLISLVKSIIDLIHQLHQHSPAAAQVAMGKLRAAILAARDVLKGGGDVDAAAAPLHQLHDDLQLHCSGVACPPEPVGNT